MSIDTKVGQLSESLNGGNPNTIADGLRVLKFGNHMLQQKTRLVRVVPTVQAGYDATLKIYKLPEMAKAASIIKATGYAAGAGAALTVIAGNTPATGQIAVTSSGDIAVLAADAHLALDVLYEPEVYDVVETSLPVATNVLTLPTSLVALVLLEATALTGTSTGAKIVDAQADAAAAAGKAKLTSKGLTVLFAGADAVTSAHVKLAVARKVDVQATLVAQSAIG